MQIKSRLVYATLFYLLVSLLVFVSKPRLLFHEDGSLRRVGLSNDETLFGSLVICAVAAIASFYMFVIIDLALE